MNTIFIDITTSIESKNESKNKILNKVESLFSQIILKKDLISSNQKANYYLEIKSELLVNIDNERKRKRIVKKIVKKISKYFKSQDAIYIILSESIITDKNYYNYIVEVFNSEKFKNNKIIFAETKNELLKTDMKYIDKFILENKLSDDKIKILVVLKHFEEYNETKIKEYIDRFKYVDILRLSDMSKVEYKKLISKIDEINDEYGCSISCIQRRNVQDYNVYISYFDYSKKEFKKKYIANKNSVYLNMCDASEDIFSEAYKKFKNNEVDLNILFKRLDMKIDKFNKAQLGSWLLM